MQLLTDPNNKELRLQRVTLELLENSLRKQLFTMKNSIETSNPRKDQSATRLGTSGAPGQDNLDSDSYISGSRGEYLDLESLAKEAMAAEVDSKAKKAAYEAAKKLVLLKGTPIVTAKPIVVHSQPQASYNPISAAETKVKKNIGL